ncbi:MAG: helix-turn-helix domain-containing protein [Thermoleophilaceae bacterium]
MNAAELIREARRRHRIDQRSLAHRSGTSQTHISRIERGEVSPGVETVERLLAVMGERLELRAVPGPRGNDSTESNSAPGSGERHQESAWRRPPSSPTP